MTRAAHEPEPSTRGRRPSSVAAVALSLLVATALVVGACSSKSTVATPTPSASDTPAAATGTPTSDAATQAIMAVIEKANAEQQQALAQHDPTIMQDTATPDYYSLLVQTQQDLEQAGVTVIKLLSLNWGDIAVQGTSAQAATTETWQVNFSDGTSQQSTDRNVYTLVEQGGSWLIAGDAQVSSSVGQPGATTTSQSRNWAGYAATGGPFTAVSGTWTVPTVSPTTTNSADATWVGIGGVNSTDLIQAGTEASVSASGQVTYDAWYELLPANVQPVQLDVSPGNVVTVTITQQSAGTWQIAIQNKTTNQNFQTTVQYMSSLSSAEWIEEAPSTASARAHVVALDDFGQVQFQDASTRLGGQQVTIAQANAQPITMYDRSSVIASPSSLGADGASFTVTRVNP